MKAIANRQSLRYLAIAALSAISYNAIIIALDYAGISYLIGVVVATAVVITGAYLAHATVTFSQPLSLTAYMRFVSAQIAGFFLSVIILAAMIDGLQWPVIVATPVATVLLFAYNFISARWAILTKR
ncbi:GtrA family protein [Altererythrobacter lutimaris]|uniref:GtrA family protein n=1 Tax=Altererythrobacter lutimaris TaxID=2743979 RepID=A0A850HAQ6_9SPHN|nr:GtrA family protein [Altererythrobacter lutimaris]NVE94590.1 GtrA family protein [Altererythrobacter lutimaris]